MSASLLRDTSGSANSRAAPRRGRWRAAVGACALAAALAGCTNGLFKSEQSAAVVYQLRPAPGAALEPVAAADLAVLRPFTRPGLESERIVVWLPDRRLDAYTGSRWSAPLPDMVQSLLLDELRARGGWKNVLLDRGEFRGQYVLQTEIRDFQAEYAAVGQAPTVRVTLRSELGRAPNRTPVATLVGTGEVRAAADRMSEVVAAFEQAYAQAAAQVAAGAHAAALGAEKAAIPATPSRETAR